MLIISTRVYFINTLCIILIFCYLNYLIKTSVYFFITSIVNNFTINFLLC